MIDWVKTSERLPAKKGDLCLLYNANGDKAVGPLPWFDAENGWMDIFATPEAGYVYSTDTVTHWASWNAPTDVPDEEQPGGFESKMEGR